MAYATVGSLIERYNNFITEIISKKMEVFLPSVDPVFRDMIVSSRGVVPADQIGRDMKIIRTFKGGLTGVLEMAKGRGDFVLYGDATTDVGAKLFRQSATQVWPDALRGPKQQPYRLAVGMQAMLTNLAMTLGEMQMEANPAAIGEVVTPTLRGFSMNLVQTLANYWYVDQNSSYKLCETSSVTNSSTTTVFTPKAGEIDRFYVGQMVDIVSNAGVRVNDNNGTGSQTISTQAAIGYVTKVDEARMTVTITWIHPTTGAAVDPATFDGVGANTAPSTATPTNQYVVLSNSVFVGASAISTGFQGINSWLKWDTASDKYLLGSEKDSSMNIDISVHPEFGSLRWASVGALTEHTLRLYLRAFHRVKRKYGQEIDTVIGSEGVWLNYEASKIGQYQIDRTNRLSSLGSEGSDYDGFEFVIDGKKYKGLTSTYIEDGTVYGIKKGGSNWKIMVPPRAKGLQKSGDVPSFIPFDFVGPALMGSTKIPIFGNSGASITEAVQLPGMVRMGLVPDQPAGLKLEGVTYDKVTM